MDGATDGKYTENSPETFQKCKLKPSYLFKCKIVFIDFNGNLKDEDFQISLEA